MQRIKTGGQDIIPTQPEGAIGERGAGHGTDDLGIFSSAGDGGQMPHPKRLRVTVVEMVDRVTLGAMPGAGRGVDGVGRPVIGVGVAHVDGIGAQDLLQLEIDPGQAHGRGHGLAVRQAQERLAIDPAAIDIVVKDPGSGADEIPLDLALVIHGSGRAVDMPIRLPGLGHRMILEDGQDGVAATEEVVEITDIIDPAAVIDTEDLAAGAIHIIHHPAGLAVIGGVVVILDIGVTGQRIAGFVLLVQGRPGLGVTHIGLVAPLAHDLVADLHVAHILQGLGVGFGAVLEDLHPVVVIALGRTEIDRGPVVKHGADGVDRGGPPLGLGMLGSGLEGLPDRGRGGAFDQAVDAPHPIVGAVDLMPGPGGLGAGRIPGGITQDLFGPLRETGHVFMDRIIIHPRDHDLVSVITLGYDKGLTLLVGGEPEIEIALGLGPGHLF